MRPCLPCGARGGRQEPTPSGDEAAAEATRARLLFSGEDPAQKPPVSRQHTRTPYVDGLARVSELGDALAALASLRTGDILLYQNGDLGSLVNMVAMQSSFAHAGVVVELPHSEARALYPEDYAAHPPPADKRLARLHVFEAVEERGVCLFPLEARLARSIKYNRYIAVRALRADSPSGRLPAEAYSRALEHVRQVRGRPLAVALNAPYLVQDCVRLYVPCVPQAARADGSKYSCGELVTSVLQALGVLADEAVFTSSSTLPTFLTSSDGVAGQLRLEQFLLPGRAYGPDTLLLFPGCAFIAHLEARKNELKQHAAAQKARPDGPKRHASIIERVELM